MRLDLFSRCFDSKIFVFLLILIGTFFARIDSFLYSSFDWDESIYFLVAESLLQGNLPYIAAWDIKPPGIFLIYAAAFKTFGTSYIAIRIAACIAISLGAFGLYLLVRRHARENFFIAIIVPLLYVMMFRLNGGLASNTEVFYIPFIIYAFLVSDSFLKRISEKEGSPKTFLTLVTSGILIGFAGLIHYLALLYTLPLGIYYLTGYFEIQRTHKILQFVLTAAAAGLAGISIVFIPVVAIYFFTGHIDEFIYANFIANSIYISSSNQPFDLGALLIALVNQFSANWLVWTLVLAYFPLSKHYGYSPRLLVFGLGWLLASLVAILVSRLYWPHYFLQFIPPLAVFSAMTLGVIASIIWKSLPGLALLTIFLLLIGGYYEHLKVSTKQFGRTIFEREVNGNPYWGDRARQIAHRINNELGPEDHIFVVDANPIIYHLTSSKLPTKYPFPPHLIGTTSSKMLPVDPVEVISNIIDSRPTFIIKKSERPDPNGTLDGVYARIDHAISEDYYLYSKVSEVDIYHIREKYLLTK